MLRCWLRYVSLLLLSALLYIFYVGYVSWFLFVLVCSLPILSFLLFLLAKRTFEVRLICNKQYQKQDKELLHICARTRSIIPLACARMTLTMKNAFTKEMSEETIKLTAERNFTEIEIPLPLEHCGKLEISLTDVKLFDFLGLFHASKKHRFLTVVYIYPKKAAWQTPVLLGNPVEEAGTAMDLHGNDIGDTFDVHAYRPGDSLHRVHWKLSAKMDELMVREFSSYHICTTAIFFEFYGTHADCEAILSNVYNFSCYLLEQGSMHDIAQYAYGQQCWRTSIKTIAELNSCIEKILSQSNECSLQPTFCDAMEQENVFLIQKDGVWNPHGGDFHA